MINLFRRCLNANYVHTEKGGDYAIEVEGDTLYLLFEWSDGVEDWQSNFDFPARPYKDMKPKWRCHRGFLRVWKDIRNDLEDYVAERLKYHPEITNIVCVGYSHGAAISVFATEDMEYLYGEKYSVRGYGFGCPRVLWGIVPKEVKRRLSNFVAIRNIPDIVTHVPPMLFGFKHAGTLLKIGEKDKYSPVKAHYASAYIEELNATKGEEEW